MDNSRCIRTWNFPNMTEYLALVLCFTLSFGFIELSHLNEEQPSYVLLFKSGTKMDSQAQSKDKEFQSTYIPLIKVGRKREPEQASEERNFTLPYIPPIEFGRKRETTNALTEQNVSLPFLPPIEFGRKRETRQHLMEKLRTFRSKRDGSKEK